MAESTPCALADPPGFGNFSFPSSLKALSTNTKSSARKTISFRSKPIPVGIGFERKEIVLRAEDFVFVDSAFSELGNEKFPNPGGSASAHGVDSAIPAIE